MNDKLLERYEKVRKRAEQSRAEFARLKGKEEVLLKRLKDDFDADDFDAGVKLLGDVEKDLVEKEGELDELVTTLEKIFVGEPV